MSIQIGWSSHIPVSLGNVFLYLVMVVQLDWGSNENVGVVPPGL